VALRESCRGMMRACWEPWVDSLGLGGGLVEVCERPIWARCFAGKKLMTKRRLNISILH
jgi:hypothetical protein